MMYPQFIICNAESSEALRTMSPQVRQRILAAIGTSGPFSNTQVESKDKLVTCQANNTNIRLTKVENEIKTLKTISL